MNDRSLHWPAVRPCVPFSSRGGVIPRLTTQSAVCGLCAGVLPEIAAASGMQDEYGFLSGR
ncbi:hypothetical protein [Neglectibacter timonensis]|uniref:Uncharacterized protein n=1 Tax=Neglectibacter timonensis TaxID=1776382 RepID=A0ABT1S299_9FIRM|nr:hypothetical protein [Neglectibacter timonensis]MCQ4841066.1 hypothetical protein [Neglectibacter timonensis]MCQ4844704.1 hypothetical protein [Neglectibacter timonensis]